MPAAVADRVTPDVQLARRTVDRDAVDQGTVDRAWGLLEEAHVLSQPWAWPHIKVHAAMLRLGWRTRDRREVAGQLVRIVVAGPGSLTGRYPEGNTGRADVPATRPMPVADELRGLLDMREA